MTGSSLTTQRARFIFERRGVREAAELGLAALAFLLYFVVRANVIDRPDLALANAREIVALERALGIYVEAAWQAWVLDAAPLIRVANFVYFWLDFPLIVVVGLVMYVQRPGHYTFTRDAILFSGAAALVCYALLPVAPPRLLPEAGIADTLQQLSNLSYQAQSTSFFVNPYAAVPSLHVGWAFLLALGVMRAWPRNRVVLVFAFLHPISQWAATVVTGNHYFLDGVAGVGVAAIGVALAYVMRRWGYEVASRIIGHRYRV